MSQVVNLSVTYDKETCVSLRNENMEFKKLMSLKEEDLFFT